MTDTTTSSNQATSDWLAQNLAQLLSSPYIHFSTPKFGIPGLRLGPGPIDLFSTRFSNLFSSEAKGKVAGTEVDKAGLKEALLALQKTWNTDTSSVTAAIAPAPQEIAAELCWTPHKTDTAEEVKAIATTIEEGGASRISFLELDGKSSLFTAQSQ